MITKELYDRIKKYILPVFLIFVIIFFAKEIILALDRDYFVILVPDSIFLIIFAVYFIWDFLPFIKPDWIEGYELPKTEEYEIGEDTDEEDEEEGYDLEKISL